MDRDDWLLTVGALLLGQAALVVIEVVRSQLGQWQQRRDRRDDRQGDTLRALQDALAELIIAAAGVMSERDLRARGAGAWTPADVERWADDMHKLTTRAMTHRVRVRDQQARDLANEVLGAVDDVVRASTKDSAEGAFAKADAAHERANERIGELLREL